MDKRLIFRYLACERCGDDNWIDAYLETLVIVLENGAPFAGQAILAFPHPLHEPGAGGLVQRGIEGFGAVFDKLVIKPENAPAVGADILHLAIGRVCVRYR